jgi:hypothetical protein
VNLRIDLFRSQLESNASEFAGWPIPPGGASGTLPGLMMTIMKGACYYTKAYVGEPKEDPTIQVTTTKSACY